MHNFYLTDFIRKLIFGKSSMGKVLLLVVIFLVNLGLVTVIDGYLIYDIPKDQPFSEYLGGEVLSMYGTTSGYVVLYRADSNENRFVKIQRNDITGRCRIDHSSEIVVSRSEDPYVYDNGNVFSQLQFTVENDAITQLSFLDFQLFSFHGNNTLAIYMLIALIMLLAETFVINKFHSLFR